MFNKITSFEVTKDNIEILDNEFVKTASEIILPEGHTYDPDFTYMKVRAVSAGEYWGNNKNADYFPEAELIKNYKTFFDAHVFKNHENKDVEKAIGDVLDATWNDEMKYVELLIRVDKRIAPTIARGFEKGFMTDVSMGCKIDHSICSICGNVAKTQSQYCDHIKYEKHKVYDDGRKVFEININPRFHDISAVLNGADRTAKMTGLYISGTKVAYFEEESLEKTASFEEELSKEAMSPETKKLLAQKALGAGAMFAAGMAVKKYNDNKERMQKEQEKALYYKQKHEQAMKELAKPESMQKLKRAEQLEQLRRFDAKAGPTTANRGMTNKEWNEWKDLHDWAESNGLTSYPDVDINEYNFDKLKQIQGGMSKQAELREEFKAEEAYRRKKQKEKSLKEKLAGKSKKMPGEVTHYEAKPGQNKAQIFGSALKSYGWVSNRQKRDAYVSQELAKQNQPKRVEVPILVQKGTVQKPGKRYFENQRGEVYEVSPTLFKKYQNVAKAKGYPFKDVTQGQSITKKADEGDTETQVDPSKPFNGAGKVAWKPGYVMDSLTGKRENAMKQSLNNATNTLKQQGVDEDTVNEFQNKSNQIVENEKNIKNKTRMAVGGALGAGAVGLGMKMMKRASFEDAFGSDLDETPLFEKVASTKKTAKELEVEKLAEIKKRIKGKIVGVAKQRLEEEQSEAFSDGMAEYHSNFMSPISDLTIDRVADRLSYISDRENIPVEVVISKLLKVLIMAGINLAPVEFGRLMNRAIAPECEGGLEGFSMPPRTIVRIRRRTMDDALGARSIDGMNVPTVIRVIKKTRMLPSMSEMLPGSMGSGASGRIVMMKLASSGEYGLDDSIHGLAESRVERELVKIASELMEERSLHTHCILKRAEAMGEEMEKVAGCDDYVAQYDYFRGENATLAEEFNKIAYTTYINMAKEYVESRELQSDLFKYAEELGLNDTGLDKIAKWKPIKTIPVGVGTYLAAKYQGVKAREGRPQTTLERTMAENPQASALGAYLAANVGIHSYGKAKNAVNKGAKAMGEKLVELKDKAKIVKKATENVDNYLNLRFEDELFDNINDEIQDIDVFHDKVVDEKLANFYDEEQIGMLKLASLVYAQERQDVCDNVLAKAGLKYEDMGIFLEACEETVYEELEKKAGIMGAIAKGVGSLGAKAGAKFGGTALGSAIGKASPMVNTMKNAVQPAIDKVQPAVQNVMAKPGAKTALKTVGAGVGTGVGAGIANKVMNNNKQPQNNTIIMPQQ